MSLPLGPPPDPVDKRFHQWTSQMWKYLTAINRNASVSSIVVGTGLTGGTITTTGTIAIGTVITAGTVGSATVVPILGYNALGQITSVATGTIGAMGTFASPTFTGTATADNLVGNGIFNSQSIGTGVTLTVPSGYGLAVVGPFVVSGDLVVSGDMVVL